MPKSFVPESIHAFSDSRRSGLELSPDRAGNLGARAYAERAEQHVRMVRALEQRPGRDVLSHSRGRVLICAA